jgi:hypothetical protein
MEERAGYYSDSQLSLRRIPTMQHAFMPRPKSVFCRQARRSLLSGSPEHRAAKLFMFWEALRLL